MAELNFRQRLFIEAYLGKANGNATKAAQIAGYPHPNKTGPRLLVNVGIQAAIDARVDEAALSTSEILARLSDQATATLEDFITVKPDGSFSIDLKRAKKAGRLHTLRKIKQGPNGVEIETYSSQDALEKLARYRGILQGEGRSSPEDNDRVKAVRETMPRDEG